MHINTFQYISNSNIQDWSYWLPADTILKELQIIYISLRNSAYFYNGHFEIKLYVLWFFCLKGIFRHSLLVFI